MTSSIDLGTLPQNPGCYLFKDSAGIILYVGKAVNLQKRVKSYFLKNDLDPKTQSLVTRIHLVDCFVTNSEVEALILESNLIKKHQPRYNINLKDSKQYALIELTKEEFPRLLLSRKANKEGNFFGPFVSSQDRDYVMRFLNKAFHLRTCRRLPKRACLRYHLGLCTAPCIMRADKAGYAAQVAKAVQVLKGNSKPLLQQLQGEMSRCSGSLEYEEAALLRDQIAAITFLSEHQNMQRSRAGDEDIINYIVQEGRVYLMLFNTFQGTLLNKEQYIFDEAPEFFEEFLLQYYDSHDLPQELIVPVAMSGAMQAYLNREKKMTITVPKQGQKKELIELAKKNIEISLLGSATRLRELRQMLKLPRLPEVIECIDISHLGGTLTVGSLVQFRQALPDKTNYRRFRIQTVEGVNDLAAIAEVVHRRYARLTREGSDLPDLIIIDGGKEQLSSAVRELRKLKARIPAIALAKKNEDVYVPGLKIPLHLPEKSPALLLLRQIRDEAHRFALAYNKLLRSKVIKK